MAVTVDWGTGVEDRELGIYGIYNKFVGHINLVSGKIYKPAFRIRVTALNDPTKTYTKDVDAVEVVGGYVANVNPVQAMQVLFFGSEYTGSTESTSIKSYSGVQIEIGEVSAATIDVAPTFKGYDTDDTFYFYNGYEQGIETINMYRDPFWYTSTPHKLPKVKKTLYLQDGDVELLSMPSYLNVYPVISGGTNLLNLITEFYDSSDSLLSTSTIDLRARPDLSGVGYWNININFAFVTNTVYTKTYCQWATDGATSPVNSEEITIYRQLCNPKNDPFRLRWVNRYGGDEAENFTLKHDRRIIIKRGKKVQSSGVDYASTTFAGISNINNPNLREFGNSYYTEWKLRTDFITQEQINALAELFRNNSVIMFESDVSQTNPIPVMVQNSSYELLDVKNALQKIEVTVRLANIEPNQI